MRAKTKGLFLGVKEVDERILIGYPLFGHPAVTVHDGRFMYFTEIFTIVNGEGDFPEVVRFAGDYLVLIEGEPVLWVTRCVGVGPDKEEGA